MLIEAQENQLNDGKRRILEGQDVEIEEKEIPYTLVDNLGYGAHGFVEKVKDVTTGKCYARKKISITRGRLNQAKQMLQQEVDNIRALALHPHVIRVHSTYIAGRTLAIILQPVADSGNLDQFLSTLRDHNVTHKNMEYYRVAVERGITCLASCLNYLHSTSATKKDVIRHKDIKPSNILVHEGYMILTDFGISKRCVTGPTTTTGKPEMFTPRYCAPEVADYDSRNRKADVFSLGCVLLEMQTALEPSTKVNEFLDVESYPYHQVIEDIQSIIATKSPVYKVISKMLERDPELRYSALDTITELHNCRILRECDKCQAAATSLSPPLALIHPQSTGLTIIDPSRPSLIDIPTQAQISNQTPVTVHNHETVLENRTVVVYPSEVLSTAWYNQGTSMWEYSPRPESHPARGWGDPFPISAMESPLPSNLLTLELIPDSRRNAVDFTNCPEFAPQQYSDWAFTNFYGQIVGVVELQTGDQK